jgi:hypothetical protein
MLKMPQANRIRALSVLVVTAVWVTVPETLGEPAPAPSERARAPSESAASKLHTLKRLVDQRLLTKEVRPTHVLMR